MPKSEGNPLPESYSKKLEKAFEIGQLCVGIDPHSELLIDEGLDDSVSSVDYFASKILDELSGVISIIKPQVSFFERFGSKGFAVLEKLLIEANQRKFFVIVDAKRGDIGSTMDAYSQAWLAKDAPFIADAITVNPFLGLGTLNSTLATAVERGKGLFALCATSNPEAGTIQNALLNGVSISQAIASESALLNDAVRLTNSKFGNLGLVVGATIDQTEIGLEIVKDKSSNLTPILAPGFGYQGARLQDAARIFEGNKASLIATISRSALRDGLGNVGSVVKRDLAELTLALQS